MLLRSLHLQNFRQHADTTLEFHRGLTGIIGPNGAGKSTILEAIAWAVYGASAARGTNDTIRFLRAPPRARVAVDLTFELDQHEYRVSRSLNSADVYLDNGVNPVATGVGAATAYLQHKLGMTRQEFFNTYFTGQKELQFLAQMGPTERGRFLAQVLGYERLRKAQDIAKSRRRELGAEIDGLKAGLPDPAELKTRHAAAEKRLREAKKNVGAIERNVDRLEKQLAGATPRWAAAQSDKERAQKLGIELDSAVRELAGAQREVERAAVALQKVSEAEQHLAAIKPHLEELSAVKSATEKLEILARAHARAGVLQKAGEKLAAEIDRLETALKGLKQAPALLKKTQEELAEVKRALTPAVAAREALLADWQKEAQDNQTQLRMLGDQQKELEEQILKLQTAGETGSCPICTKPLGDEYGTVLEHLELELEDRRNVIKWRTSRAKQLTTRPQALVDAEKQLAQLQAALQKKVEREAKCEQAVKDLWERTEEHQLKTREMEEHRVQLAAAANDYDPAEHERQRNRLAELEQFARHASVYEHEIAARATREADVASAKSRHAELEQRIDGIRRDIAALAFNEKTYEDAKESFAKVTKAMSELRVSDAEAKQALSAAEETLNATLRDQAAYEEKREKLTALESEFRHHHEMDTALTRLRTELNARVRPELADLASSFLVDITDGRYTSIELDESYNVMVLEDGEEKPVISGGEEDVANLVLRIAISQMIAERAGQHLSALFLDEVFGSLDLERRDNVIQLLQKLHDRFEQVVLITHVETVREGLDHVIRLSYDEKSGASVASGASGAGAWELEKLRS